METHQLEGLLAKLRHTTEIAGLSAVLASLREAYGLATIVYHAVSIPLADRADPVILLPHDDPWIRRYIENDYVRIDPIVRRGRNGFLPLDWSEIDRETPEAQHLFEDADQYGVGRRGVTLPVRGPAGERALFTVTSNASEADWLKKRVHYMREFQIVAHFIHDRAIELSGHRQRNRKVGLSAREAQCLALVIKGWHTKQIASRLNVSTSIVQLHLQNARQKLDCASIPEAAAKAVRWELIDDDDDIVSPRSRAPRRGSPHKPDGMSSL